MSNNEPLTPAELISPVRRYERILAPDEIPVHATVYEADFPYTEEFVEKVMQALPESIRRDISEIERILGKQLGLEVDEKGIHEGERLEISFSAIYPIVNTDKHTIDIHYASSNIGLGDVKGSAPLWLQLREDHPMDIGKLKSYGIPPEDFEGQMSYPLQNIDDPEFPLIRNWYTHNSLSNGLPGELLFRNVAIQFNNLGREELAKK